MARKKKVKTISASAPIAKAKFFTIAFQKDAQKIARGYVGFEYDESKGILKCEFTSEKDALNFQENMKKWS